MDAQAALKFNNEAIANCDRSLAGTLTARQREIVKMARARWVTDLAQLKELIANGETVFTWTVPGVVSET
jgi:hypothetical protein